MIEDLDRLLRQHFGRDRQGRERNSRPRWSSGGARHPLRVGLVAGATPLTGGVTNGVFRLESARGALVLRVTVAVARALGRLHTAAASLALPPRPRHARFADLPFPSFGQYPHELDARVREDWQAWDLACATWEFSKGPDPRRLDATAARRFLGAYRAAGAPVSEQEDDLLRPLMRVKRSLEVLRAPTDRRVDWSYQRENLLAAETLA